MHVDHKVSFHPYLIITSGDDILNLTNIYVSILDELIKVESVPAAVKLCFQYVNVLHKEFPAISNHVWHFLSLKVFDMTVATGKNVNDVVQNL